MLLEGKRLIKEALLKNLKLEYLLFSRKADIDFFKSTLPSTGAKLYKMPYNEMKLWSSLSTPPGVMGKFCQINVFKLLMILQVFLRYRLLLIFAVQILYL